MYLEHFRLQRHPFRITPDTEFFFNGGARGAILDALLYALTSGEGIVKVTGEVGSGKTMLCRALEGKLDQKFEVIYLANPGLAATEILQAIAWELKLPITDNPGQLSLLQTINNYLLDRHAAGRRVVLFIEEAQNMPLATLEEIRMLANLETSTDKLLQIVMFGQPELEEILGKHSIRQLRERITHSFNLAPLDSAEVDEYLRFRLGIAGCPNPGLFVPKASRIIAETSQGLLRRINILADKAMLAAYAEHSPRIEAHHAKAASQDSAFPSLPEQRFSRLLKWRPLAVGAGALLLIVALLAIGYGVGLFLKQEEGVAVIGQQFKVTLAAGPSSPGEGQ